MEDKNNYTEIVRLISVSLKPGDKSKIATLAGLNVRTLHKALAQACWDDLTSDQFDIIRAALEYIKGKDELKTMAGQMLAES
jgi:hypothetical protein